MTIYQVIEEGHSGPSAKKHDGYFRIRPVFSFDFKEEEETMHEIEDDDIFIDLLRYQPKKIDIIKMGFKHMEFVDFIKNFAGKGF